jgi:hypothetical protein
MARRWTRFGVLSTVAAAGLALAGVGPAAAATTIVVGPGQSIQAAVDRAQPGDTIVIKPGTYRESVLVRKDRLTIKGSGAGPAGTILQPGPSDPANPCSRDGGNGICVFGTASNRVGGVTITHLVVRDYAGDGIVAVETDNLVVAVVTARGNGGYGIARFASGGGAIVDSLAVDNRDAGFYVGDSPNAQADVVGNVSRGNELGVFVRHARRVAVEGNVLTGNCIGVLLLNDDQPGGAGNHVVGFNDVRGNNRVCRIEGVPPFGGSGIAVLGATDSVIQDNAVLNNRGNTFPSGGIVLLPSFGGAPATGNVILRNTAFRNAPADIVDNSGPGANTFSRNECGRSQPAGLCR